MKDKKQKMTFQLKKILGNRIAIISLFLLVFSTNIESQDFKLGGIHYANYPNSAIKDVSGNQETSFHEFGAFVNFPIKFKNNKTVMVNGFGYGYVVATMYNFPSLLTSENQKKLQSFYYQLMFLHKWNEKWSLLVNLKPTIASDFEQKLSMDDFVFQGAVIATRTINNNFKIGAGVASSTRWGSPRVIPVVNLHYKNNRHNVNALLPINFKYTYSLLPDEKLKLGLKYARNGANSNISATDMTKIDKIEYSRANIGILANYQLTKILRMEAYGGISTQRIYNLVDVDENVYDFDSKTAPFFSVGIVFALPQRK